jgi:dihydroorotase
MRTYIHHVKIVNEGKVFEGAVVIRDDEIEEVLQGESLPSHPFSSSIDGKGCYLLPGVIDEHVHFREPGLTDKADILNESIAAAAGGVTSVMDMPNTVPQTVTSDAYDAKMELFAQRCVTNYSCYMGATNNNIDTLTHLNPHRVCGIKVFMGASTGNMLVDNERILRDIFSIDNVLIATHCEDQQTIAENLARYKSEMVNDDLPVAYHCRIRSSRACYRSSASAVHLARVLGTQLHILHVSTATELKLFDKAPLTEKKITAEVCAGYLQFTARDYTRKGALIKVNPAIKRSPNRVALIDAINDGRIDTIATDHAPHCLTEKQGGALKAKSGMPIIQFSLPCMLELVSKGLLSLPTLVSKMCHAPSLLYQIHQRGFIRQGYKADLVLVNPDRPHTIQSSDVLSKCGWTPLEGTLMHWKVVSTFINGHLVYDGEQVDTTYRGEELSFR